jgi:hypothetical protein
MSNHKLRLIALSDPFAVCKLESIAPVPTWASSADFLSITRTADELSIVCPQDLVPDGIRCEPGWRCLRVAGTMDFSMIGVVASLVTPLAQAGISVFVISTFDTDYLLVKETNFEAALSALRSAGHEVP